MTLLFARKIRNNTFQSTSLNIYVKKPLCTYKVFQNVTKKRNDSKFLLVLRNYHQNLGHFFKKQNLYNFDPKIRNSTSPNFGLFLIKQYCVYFINTLDIQSSGRCRQGRAKLFQSWGTFLKNMYFTLCQFLKKNLIRYRHYIKNQSKV